MTRFALVVALAAVVSGCAIKTAAQVERATRFAEGPDGERWAFGPKIVVDARDDPFGTTFEWALSTRWGEDPRAAFSVRVTSTRDFGPLWEAETARGADGEPLKLVQKWRTMLWFPVSYLGTLMVDYEAELPVSAVWGAASAPEPRTYPVTLYGPQGSKRIEIPAWYVEGLTQAAKRASAVDARRDRQEG